MLKDITVGQYFPVDSPIHRMDPRVKLVLTFAFIVLIFLVNKFIAYAFILAYILFAIKISKVPLSYTLKGLKPLVFIIVLTVLLNIFFTPGSEALFSIGSLTIYKQGVIQAAFMGLRLIFLVIGTTLLTLTTSPISLTDGIEYLLTPLKVFKFPTHELAMMMTIALRFIPTLLEETDKIMKAQMARGADFETGNIIKRAKSLIPLLVPLFISAFRRADELADAMEARCYRGGQNRTRMKVLKTTSTDYKAIGFTAVIFILVIYVGYI
ncbi:MAG: energy-coupling factor transporter transmembrane component T [Clostridia bacterium]|nr:energy-coupling factor transporter transmembrane component T [Clostridia bacterium]